MAIVVAKPQKKNDRGIPDQVWYKKEIWNYLLYNGYITVSSTHVSFLHMDFHCA